jgi:hypothetical protein
MSSTDLEGIPLEPSSEPTPLEHKVELRAGESFVISGNVPEGFDKLGKYGRQPVIARIALLDKPLDPSDVKQPSSITVARITDTKDPDITNIDMDLRNRTQPYADIVIVIYTESGYAVALLDDVHDEAIVGPGNTTNLDWKLYDPGVDDTDQETNIKIEKKVPISTGHILVFSRLKGTSDVRVTMDPASGNNKVELLTYATAEQVEELLYAREQKSLINRIRRLARRAIGGS